MSSQELKSGGESQDSQGVGGSVINSRYQKVQKLGEGTYSQTFLVKDKQNDVELVMKVFSIDHYPCGVPPEYLRTLSVMKLINHPCLVSVQDILCEKGKIYTIMECLCNYEWLNKIKEINNDLIVSFSFQLLSALYYLHCRGIVNIGLSIKNVFLNKKTGVIKIGDYSSSSFIYFPGHNLCDKNSTDIYYWYRAPESLLNIEHDARQADIWSIACIIYEVAFYHSGALFKGDSAIDTLYKIAEVVDIPSKEEYPQLYACPKELLSFMYVEKEKKRPLETIFKGNGSDVDEKFVNLLSKMLVFNPNKRITAYDALNHPFFTSNPKAYFTGFLK